MLSHRPDGFLVASTSLVGITVLSGLILSSSIISATSVTDTASVNVTAACTLSTSSSGSYSTTIAPGNYSELTGSVMNVSCNDPGGYALYAIGFSGDSYTGDNTKMIHSTNSSYSFSTGTSGSNSYWAMKAAVSGTNAPTIDNSFSSYQQIPSTYTKISHYTANTTGTSNSVTTPTYKVNISSTQPAGTYTGQVKYTLVHPASEEPLQPQPATAGCINYFANASTTVGEMGCQSATDNASVDLWASNFKRDGYGFAGWNDKFDYSGNFYGPNQTITAPADVSTNGLSLYAVWIKSAGSLQNWNGCSSLASGATTALTDERDNNTYAVAKLADGKCWTIENLRLADKDSSNSDINLSSSNTHNPSLPITNVYDATNPTTSNHLSATTDPTTNAWCQDNSSACDDQSMLATNNTTLFTNNTSTSYSSSSNVYSYGNYYNWYSATAGHGKYGSSYASDYIAPGDICPAGWHLPTGKTTGEYYALNTAINDGTVDSTASNRLRSYPNNFVYSGRVYGSSVSSRSSGGYYWSSSANNSGNAYYLRFNSSSVYPGTNNYGKYVGGMVRCVAGV